MHQVLRTKQATIGLFPISDIKKSTISVLYLGITGIHSMTSLRLWMTNSKVIQKNSE